MKITSHMKRRQLLAATGIGLFTTYAGCLGDERPADEGDENGVPENNDENDANGNNHDNDQVIKEDPRVDKPPHKITRPDEPEDGIRTPEWNEDYLGENMKEKPSLNFGTIEINRGLLPNRRSTYSASGEYWTELLNNEAERDEVLDVGRADKTTRDRLAKVDFDESVLIVIETGYGSGSVEHRWVRTEDCNDAAHLHGYYSNPYEQTDDLTTWVSLLEVERPENNWDFARVSLTVSEERRIHFNSTEGVVTLDG